MSQMAEFLSFSWLDNIPLMRTTSVFIHLLIDPWVVSISWLLWIMLQWTWWYRYLFKILFSFFWLHTLEWNCWYYGSSTFNFLRNFYAAFHNGCTNLHSHHRCTRVPILHIFINTWYDLSFYYIHFSMKWYLIVVLYFPSESWCWASSHELISHS